MNKKINNNIKTYNNENKEDNVFICNSYVNGICKDTKKICDACYENTMKNFKQ